MILKQSEVYISSARERPAGADVGTNSLFYGGSSSTYNNIASLITTYGTLVQNDVNVGTGRWVLLMHPYK
jgi:hypothetical protein